MIIRELSRHIRSISTVHPPSRPHSKTLSLLIRSGDLAAAQNLFNSLPSPDVSAYNAMISAHVKRRDLRHARHLFDQMPLRDVSSFNSILSGYALSSLPEEFEEGRKIFDAMPAKDSISWNTMINGYARNGRMDNAMALFNRMPVKDKDIVSWNTVINGYFILGDVGRAMKLFGEMPVKDAGSVTTVVAGLVKCGRLKEAEEVSLSGESGVDAYNTLIAGYARCGMVEEAKTLFYLVSEKSKRFKRNVVSWNTMLMCYARNKDLRSARGLFDEMPVRDLVSWNTMISGYVQGGEIDEAIELFKRLENPDSWSWNMILCGLTRKGEVRLAEELFERMPCKTVVSWNAMVAGYEKNGESAKAVELFVRMQVVGEQPDRHTLSSVLSACAGLASFRLGIQIHQLVRKRIVSDVPINNALITMYSQSGALMYAKAVFVEMAMRIRDFVSWNAMIGGLAHHGHAKEALGLFGLMRRMKVQPTYITFISVLNACSHAGLVDEGKREFNSMVRDFGINPKIEHYATLVDLIGRHGQLEEAMKVIKEMTVPPDRVVWSALLNAARVHNNARVAEFAAEELAKAEPSSSLPYVMLYNVHADEGRWGDALEVREVMHRSGVTKQPAYSWIEVGNRNHRFLSGDRSHSLSSEIFSLLESCNRNSREIHLNLFTV